MDKKKYYVEKTNNETTTVKVKTRNGKVDLQLIKKENIDTSLGFVGYIYTDSKSDDNCANYLCVSENDDISIPIHTESKGKVVGYVKVKGAGYVGVCKQSPLLLPFIVMGLILVLLLMLFNKNNITENNEVHGNNTEITIVGDVIEDYKEPTPEQQYITIPGLRTQYNLSAENKEIFLVNPAENSVYLKYTLYLDEEEIYTTDYIKPDSMVKADLYNMLEGGTYNITIRPYAFAESSNLTTINISDKLTYVAHNSFNGCKKLSSIVLPEGVTYIGEDAFNSCSNLNAVSLPTTLNSISHRAFQNCTSLTEINLMRDDLEQIEAFSGHCFRHTFASNCYKAGFKLKRIQKLLGHATLKMTEDLYVHLFQTDEADDMDRLSEAMEKIEQADDSEEAEQRFRALIAEREEKAAKVIKFA